MLVPVELKQEIIFFSSSALLTCESRTKDEKEKDLPSQHITLLASSLYGDVISRCWTINGRKTWLCWCLKWNAIHSFPVPLLPPPVAPLLERGGVEGLESQSRHWEWLLIIAVSRHLASLLGCKRQGLQWHACQGIWFLPRSEQLKGRKEKNKDLLVVTLTSENREAEKKSFCRVRIEFPVCSLPFISVTDEKIVL